MKRYSFAQIIILALFGFVSANDLFAYPNYISLGYQSCSGCHFNPYGGGPLTDYGRSIGATYISSRMFWKKKASEERIAKASGFLWQQPKNNWLRPGLSYRGLYYQVKQEGGSDSRYVPMDLSASLATIFGKKQEFTVVASISHAPTPQALKASEEKVEQYRSREHYVGYRFSRAFGVYVGLMDRIYGLRVPDHIAFSRTLPQQTMNDQSHGILGHLMLKDWEIGLQAFAGNLAQEAELRQGGFATQVEYSLAKRTRLGVSLLSSSSQYLSIMSNALHLRTGLGSKLSLLAEIGEVNKKAKETDFQSKSQYVFTQSHWFVTRGLFGLLTLESSKPDVTGTVTTYRYGPGLQYFPHNGIELRIDALNSSTGDASERVSEWQYLAQIHLWI